MKNYKSLLLITSLLILLFAISCNKTTDEKIISNTDISYLNDTVFIHDTIHHFDTLFIYDSIIFTDTIVITDTMIVNDSSEFAYLFEHYELGNYDIIYHTINKQKNPYQICSMNSIDTNINIVNEGYGIYPIWSHKEGHINYVSLSQLAIMEENIETGEKAVIYNIDRNIMFIRYSRVLDMYFASYFVGDEKKIGAIDYQSNTFIELTNTGINESNPCTSEVDDWIYFSRLDDGVWNIYRRKLDQSKEEEVYIDPDFNSSGFDISSDGKFLVTPKYKDGKGMAVFYDIKRKRIIREIEVPIEGHPGYTALSKDNKALFFVNGTPYGFDKPRNIYRMALDGTQVFQLTNYTDKLAIRPLIK